MKTLLLNLVLVAGAAAPVMAHEAGGPHTHPSALEIIALVAVIAAMAILPARLFNARRK